MSRKSQRNRGKATLPPKATGATVSGASGRAFLVGAGVAILLAILGGLYLYQREGSSPSSTSRAAALASEHSPMVGEATARVHVVEFLDPACETCAQFYPIVKRWVTENPGRVRLSVRHAAFHTGSDHVVRLLEASRNQGKYWETLEALLASQARWAPNHTVQPPLVEQSIAGVGLDLQRLAADMDSPEVAARMKRDYEDAVALKVTATPEYFVNGRPLPEFGVQQLQALLTEELERAY
jgi:protein-disulfide isomerase